MGNVLKTINPSPFIVKHSIGDTGWVLVGNTPVEVKIVSYLVEVKGEKNLTTGNKPVYNVMIPERTPEGLSYRTQAIREDDFVPSLDELLTLIRGRAMYNFN